MAKLEDNSLNLVGIQDKLYKKLSMHRYNHSVGVQYTAAALAMKYNEDMYKARLAGLLHDCAKYLSEDDILEKCVKNNINITKEERQSPSLLHGKLGAYYAKNKYNVDDNDVLEAIRCHTTGKPNMNLLEKIIFIADYIEPNRKKIPGISEIRRYAFEDIDKAVYYKLKNMNVYLLDNNVKLQGIALETYNFYVTEKKF